VEAALTLLAARAGSIGFDVNGVSLGERPVSAEPQEVSLRIRAESLFRGDNVLSLRTATPGVKLLALRYRALP
jgi:hypothetical protein